MHKSYEESLFLNKLVSFFVYLAEARFMGKIEEPIYIEWL